MQAVYEIPINGAWGATYLLTLTLSQSDKTSSGKTEESASLSIYAKGEGFYNYNNAWEENLFGYIKIGDETSPKWQIQTIPTDGTPVSLGEFSAYVKGGGEIEVKGFFYCAYSESFMPKFGLSSVSSSLWVDSALVEIEPVLEKDFSLEDGFNLKLSGLCGSLSCNLLVECEGEIIKTIENCSDNVSFSFSPKELSKIYSALSDEGKAQLTLKAITKENESELGQFALKLTVSSSGNIWLFQNNEWRRAAAIIGKLSKPNRGVAVVFCGGNWKRGV